MLPIQESLQIEFLRLRSPKSIESFSQFDGSIYCIDLIDILMNNGPFQALKLFSVNSRPYGLTYEQWSIKWWAWLLKIPIQNNPVNDDTGRNAYLGQEDADVFFLCQTFGQNKPNPSRQVSVQKGKSLFMPLINWISTAPEDGQTDDDLITIAKSKMDTIRDLKIILNGNQIFRDFSQYRVQSKPFCVELPKNNILGLSPGTKKMVSDGYWILTKSILKSLDLTTFGSCSAGLTKIGANYHIKIISQE